MLSTYCDTGMEWADSQYVCCKRCSKELTHDEKMKMKVTEANSNSSRSIEMATVCDTMEYLICKHTSSLSLIAGKQIYQPSFTARHLSDAAHHYLYSEKCLNCVFSDLKEIKGCTIEIKGKDTKTDALGNIHQVNIMKVTKHFEVNFQCVYDTNASYEWLLQDENRRSSEILSESFKLVYPIESNQKIWKQFLNKGLLFQCSIPSTRQFKEVRLQGIQTVDYGIPKQFVCDANSTKDYNWYIDGRKQEDKAKEIETFVFNFNHPKRVSVECENDDKSNKTSYSITMCARVKFQQNLVGYVLQGFPVVLVLFTFSSIVTTFLGMRGSCSGSNEQSQQIQASNKTGQSIIPLITSIFLTIISCCCFCADIVTDFLTFFSYVQAGDASSSMLTLIPIILSATISSALALDNFFGSNGIMREHVKAFTKNEFLKCVLFLSMLWNLGPILINLDLMNVKIQIWRLGLTANEHILMKREEYLTKLSVKLALTELIFESLGQGFLQAFILSKALSNNEICLPERDVFNLSTDLAPNWNKTKFWQFAVEQVKANIEVPKSTLSCDCQSWVANGLDHCLPKEILESIEGIDGSLGYATSCFVAECSSNKAELKTVVLAAIQVILSLFQVSFTMSLKANMLNLKHVLSLNIAWKKIMLVLIMFPYFLISISMSLFLSTYIAHKHNQQLLILMAFSSLFRLVLPEAALPKKCSRNDPTKNKCSFSAYFTGAATVILPIIAHLPVYTLTQNLLLNDDKNCMETMTNDITLFMKQNVTYLGDLVTYHTSVPTAANTMKKYLNNFNFFTDELKNVPSSMLTYANSERILSIRHGFNMFDHIFLWMGWLLLSDLILITVFLSYWIFVVRSLHIVSETVSAV